MRTSEHLAKHCKEVFLGGNWTAVNLKDTLADVSWQEATIQTNGFNSITTLTWHMGYYISQVLKVLQGGPLEGSDELSFNTPSINSSEEWDELLTNLWKEVEIFALEVSKRTDEQLFEDFAGGGYGNLYRQLAGINEHTHYHLGQIVLIKRLLRSV
ncbi:MAG: DUF1572 domain-containing protein [Bacteroidetes bacterium]|nr:DUF1572 domain-containing protein [Bacteroidota bacterium]